jgi:hypothetical protein
LGQAHGRWCRVTTAQDSCAQYTLGSAIGQEGELHDRQLACVLQRSPRSLQVQASPFSWAFWWPQLRVACSTGGFVICHVSVVTAIILGITSPGVDRRQRWHPYSSRVSPPISRLVLHSHPSSPSCAAPHLIHARAHVHVQSGRHTRKHAETRALRLAITHAACKDTCHLSKSHPTRHCRTQTPGTNQRPIMAWL